MLKEEPKLENKEKEKEKKVQEKNIFSMKDKDFEELKKYKSKPTEIKINNSSKKNPRNAHSRLRSIEKSSMDEKLELVNKKYIRAQSSSFKLFQINNNLKREADKTRNPSERKTYNVSVVDKSAKKK